MPTKNKLSIASLIKARKSVRGFLSKKVPSKKIKKIFELAQYSPSNCNIQPWFTFVCTGKSKKKSYWEIFKRSQKKDKAQSRL